MVAYEKYFDDSYVPPDNIRRFCPRKPKQEMFIGGTCTHVFEFPFYCDEGDFDEITITYLQQDKVKLTKHIGPSDVIDAENGRFVECTLTPEETAQFDDRLLDCIAQIRVDKDGTILFSRLFDITLRRTLEER